MSPAEIAIALVVGLALGSVLGLLGGGGGILAIPAFVHILGMPVDEASTTSLLVVAIGATAGLIPHAIAGRVAWRVGLLFGALGTAGLGARRAPGHRGRRPPADRRPDRTDLPGRLRHAAGRR